ncbi:MAG: superinfection exclusion B family protein [Clostridia bacterium]|nr:superinfection exclusion B family protein [Clostridia bacterium]
MGINISADKFLDSVFAGFRKVTPALLAIDIVAGLIIYGPKRILESVYLSNLPNGVLKIVGIIFLISTFLLIINVISYLVVRIRKKIYIRHLNKELELCTYVEKKMISIMYYAPSHSLLMSFYGQTKGALLFKNIIVQTTNVSSDIGYMTFSYMLQPWVVNYIKRHPGFLTMTLEESKKEYAEYYRNLDNGAAY